MAVRRVDKIDHSLKFAIKYPHYTLYRTRLPIYGIDIVRSQSFLSFDDFEGNANISVTIKSDSTVFGMLSTSNLSQMNCYEDRDA